MGMGERRVVELCSGRGGREAVSVQTADIGTSERREEPGVEWEGWKIARVVKIWRKRQRGIAETLSTGVKPKSTKMVPSRVRR